MTQNSGIHFRTFPLSWWLNGFELNISLFLASTQHWREMTCYSNLIQLKMSLNDRNKSVLFQITICYDRSINCLFQLVKTRDINKLALLLNSYFWQFIKIYSLKIIQLSFKMEQKNIYIYIYIYNLTLIDNIIWLSFDH